LAAARSTLRSLNGTKSAEQSHRRENFAAVGKAQNEDARCLAQRPCCRTAARAHSRPAAHCWISCLCNRTPSQQQSSTCRDSIAPTDCTAWLSTVCAPRPDRREPSGRQVQQQNRTGPALPLFLLTFHGAVTQTGIPTAQHVTQNQKHRDPGQAAGAPLAVPAGPRHSPL